MNKCKEKQETKKYLYIGLDSKISSQRELDNIIKILENGLLVEEFVIRKRYKTCATIIVVTSDDYKATMEIKGDTITVSSYYHEFSVDMRNDIRYVLEVEDD